MRQDYVGIDRRSPPGTKPGSHECAYTDSTGGLQPQVDWLVFRAAPFLRTGRGLALSRLSWYRKRRKTQIEKERGADRVEKRKLGRGGGDRPAAAWVFIT